jgi:Fe-Mn family superoxide dismutase
MNPQAQLAVTASPIVPAPKTAVQPTFSLPPLPYAENALEPVISAQTVQLHYRKHHQGYIDALNKLVAGTEFSAMRLTQLVMATAGQPKHATVFNNAAQSWNHAFYWQGMRAPGGGAPPEGLQSRIATSFGTLEALKSEMATAATTQFGSGWVWLVLDGDRLRVVKTANAETPLTAHMKPLLAIDVWEHAYYLDFKNRRDEYIKQVLEQLVNWEFAGRNLLTG